MLYNVHAHTCWTHTVHCTIFTLHIPVHKSWIFQLMKRIIFRSSKKNSVMVINCSSIISLIKGHGGGRGGGRWKRKGRDEEGKCKRKGDLIQVFICLNQLVNISLISLNLKRHPVWNNLSWELEISK